MAEMTISHTMRRRTLLSALGAWGASGVALGCAPAHQGSGAEAAADQLATDLARYDQLGPHATGSPGDIATSQWLADRLQAAGFQTEFQEFEAPAVYNPYAEGILSHGESIPLQWQYPGIPTPAEGISSTVGHWRPDGTWTGTPGGIALIELPLGRYSTLAQTSIQRGLSSAIEAQARAAILWTRTITGDAIALNATLDDRSISLPLATCSEPTGRRLAGAALSGDTITIRIGGRRHQVIAKNVVATRNTPSPREAKDCLVISTPTSGWFHATAERGPGIAVFLHLADRLGTSGTHRPIVMTALSGHEYAYLGGRVFVSDMAPRPANTSLWVHLGAGLAAHDWHEIGGIGQLAKLPSPEAQRFVLASDREMARAREAFAGISGLEQVYPLNAKTANGELEHLRNAGYPALIGAFSAHDHHHSVNDRLSMTSSKLIAPVAQAFSHLCAGAL